MDSNASIQKKCGFCGEEIPTDAGRCPYCGSLTKNSPVDRIADFSNEQVESVRKPISNGMKVFLTILFTVIPGIGQLAGLITAIVFMNAEDDADRKSFGVALLIATIIMFVLSCIFCFVAFLAFGLRDYNY